VRGLAIVADFLMNLQEDAERIDFSILIVDPLGNELVRSAGKEAKGDNIQFFISTKKTTKLTLCWNGKNKNNRSVGNGVYAAIIKIVDYNGKGTAVKRMLGVKKKSPGQ
jgi:hypothetical protein